MSHIIEVSPRDDLQSVLDSAPENAIIRLSEGIYRGKAVIRVPGLTIRGAGSDRTVLVHNDYAKKPHPIGWEFNTFRTYTLAVCADGVTMEDLAVVNDAGSPEIKGQEVALSVLGTGFLMRRCQLASTQDTLFTGPLPHDLIGRYEGFLLDELRAGYPMVQRFEDCRIQGTVDFIFGCANAIFENCEIHSLCDARNIGYVAAPAHDADQQDGFVFRSCRFTREAGVEDGSIFLARPWRDYGLCRFENCMYENHIAIAGFDPWSGTRRDLTARFYELPPVPGRVSWCNRTE